MTRRLRALGGAAFVFLWLLTMFGVAEHMFYQPGELGSLQVAAVIGTSAVAAIVVFWRYSRR